MIKFRSLLLATLLGSATMALAAPLELGTRIGIDFGPTAPTHFFNQVNPSPPAGGSLAAGSLIDTSNVSVDGVGFTWSGNHSFFNNDDAISIAGQPAVFNESNLTDWIGISQASGTPLGILTLAFTGLDDSLTYELVIGAGHNSAIADVLWSADGQSGTTDSSVGADSYVTLTGLSTDGNGNLVITGTGTGGSTDRQDIVVVSALHLSPVNDFNHYISNPAFGLDPAQQGFSLDPDGDHLANGLEASFGTDPGQFNAGLDLLETAGDTMSFTHPINNNPPTDLRGFYQWSPNLVDWYADGGGPDGGPTVTFGTTTASSTATVAATASEPLERLFLRAGVRLVVANPLGYYSEFAHEGFYVKDYFVYRNPHDQIYHLYYNIGIADSTQDWRQPFNEKQFGHATSTDLKTWQIHDHILPVVPGTWESDVVSAPHVVEYNGLYYMAYTGFGPNANQRMGIATSTDLFNWNRIPENPVAVGPDWTSWTETGWADFRDPGLLEWNSQWLAFNTVRDDTGKNAVAISISDDLIVWEHLPRDKAIYVTWGNPESAMAFKHAGKVYLIASQPWQGAQMWMTDDPLSGLWQSVPFEFPSGDWSGWEYTVSPEGTEILSAFLWKLNGNFIRFWEVEWDGDVPKLVTDN